MKKYVFIFSHKKSDGHAKMSNTLGGKRANLAEMSNLSIPVPPGFTISTEVCTYYMKHKKYPVGLKTQVNDAIKYLEKYMGKNFGSPANPLLLSVRSGARQSMPGMMETVLNIGLNQKTANPLINQTKNSKFVYDSLRRLMMMYSDVVMEKSKSDTTIKNGIRIQLEKSNIKTEHTLKPDFSWAKKNINEIVNQYFGKKFILLFPFCSPQLSHKKWPYFNDLIKIIKSKNPNIEIAIAPGPNEMEESKKVDAIIITNKNKSLNVIELAGLIGKASYIIGNDTGPAHMAAHLGKSGRVLFGYHTTAEKVSIETDKFRAISVKDLNKLDAEKVYLEIKDEIELIN